jgi:hypothetical protein
MVAGIRLMGYRVVACGRKDAVGCGDRDPWDCYTYASLVYLIRVYVTWTKEVADKQPNHREEGI